MTDYYCKMLEDLLRRENCHNYPREPQPSLEMIDAPPCCVFALAINKDNLVAATTRASDRGEAGRIGLPGGKVDWGETPIAALIRECREEGWKIEGIDPQPIHQQLVDGKPVAWFRVESAVALEDFKEKGRITPFWATQDAIANSGYGNEWLFIQPQH